MAEKGGDRLNLIGIISPIGQSSSRRSAREKGMGYEDIITIESGKRGGKPCIRGMRITVYDVLEYLAAGMSHLEILEDFPYLTEDDIRACLRYVADREKRRNP